MYDRGPLIGQQVLASNTVNVPSREKPLFSFGTVSLRLAIQAKWKLNYKPLFAFVKSLLVIQSRGVRGKLLVKGVWSRDSL